MLRSMVAFAGVMAVLATSTDVSAQWVRVDPFGGVRVRVPFVSVDVLPYGGGTRVRAPFTRVDTRAFAMPPYYGPPVYYDRVPVPPPVYGGPAYGVPVYPAPPTEYQSTRPAIPAGADLSAQLRNAAMQLRQSLSLRRSDADVWIEYLGVDKIVQTIDSGADVSTLQPLVINYQGVMGNPSLGSIRYARGFSQTYQLLSALVSSQSSTEVVQPEPQTIEPQTLKPEPTEPEPAESEPHPAEPESTPPEELPPPDPTPEDV